MTFVSPRTVALASTTTTVSRRAGTSDFRIRDRRFRRDVLHDVATCEWHVWCEINKEVRKRDRRGNFAKRQCVYVGFGETGREQIKWEILIEPWHGNNALRCWYCYQRNRYMYDIDLPTFLKINLLQYCFVQSWSSWKNFHKRLWELRKKCVKIGRNMRYIF